MLHRTRSIALGVAVTVVALIPLYGDPRTSPVSHPEWARMLLRALDMQDSLEVTRQASQAFSILSWRDSLAFAADRYSRAEGVRIDPTHAVISEADLAEVAYPIAIVRSGNYRVRVQLSGDPARPAEAELRAAGSDKPARTFALPIAPGVNWVEAGAVHMDAGGYTMSIGLPRGTRLERLEIAPPCLTAIEPLGGWRASAVTTAEDLAVTLVKAIDAEHELAPSDIPVELTAADFHALDTLTPAGTRSDTGGAHWLRAGATTAQVTAAFDVPAEGLYTLSAFTETSGGEGWLVDECRKSVVCQARTVAAGIAAWRPILTAPFAAGRHVITLTLEPGAGLERVRLERKKETGADYVAAVRRLGFDPGPEGPISRQRANDAMAFIKTRFHMLVEGGCGDIPDLPPGVRVAGADLALLQPTGPLRGPQPPGPNVGGPGGGVPGVPPPLPGGAPSPAPSAGPSPAESPSPSPAPVPSASPTPRPTPTPGPTPTPTPTLPPPPTTLCQPPGSAVTPSPCPS